MDGLTNLEKVVTEKWQKYLLLKCQFYKSQAFCFFGQELLNQDKCGDAIKCLDHSLKRKTNKFSNYLKFYLFLKFIKKQNCYVKNMLQLKDLGLELFLKDMNFLKICIKQL